MLNCWACNYVLSGEPDDELDSEGEEAPDIIATCPKCLTRHVYVEDEAGNLVVVEAVKANGTILDNPTA